MATYTKRYPASGTTINIRYPDGLFSKIIDSPKDYYRVTGLSADSIAYPQLFLVPADGACVSSATVDSAVHRTDMYWFEYGYDGNPGHWSLEPEVQEKDFTNNFSLSRVSFWSALNGPRGDSDLKSGRRCIYEDNGWLNLKDLDSSSLDVQYLDDSCAALDAYMVDYAPIEQAERFRLKYPTPNDFSANPPRSKSTLYYDRYVIDITFSGACSCFSVDGLWQDRDLQYWCNASGSGLEGHVKCICKDRRHYLGAYVSQAIGDSRGIPLIDEVHSLDFVNRAATALFNGQPLRMQCHTTAGDWTPFQHSEINKMTNAGHQEYASLGGNRVLLSSELSGDLLQYDGYDIGFRVEPGRTYQFVQDDVIVGLKVAAIDGYNIQYLDKIELSDPEPSTYLDKVELSDGTGLFLAQKDIRDVPELSASQAYPIFIRDSYSRGYDYATSALANYVEEGSDISGFNQPYWLFMNRSDAASILKNGIGYSFIPDIGLKFDNLWSFFDARDAKYKLLSFENGRPLSSQLSIVLPDDIINSISAQLTGQVSLSSVLNVIISQLSNDQLLDILSSQMDQISDDDYGNSQIPLVNGILALTPVFTPYKCAYIKFNCTHDTDPKNVIQNDNAITHARMKAKLDEIYGKSLRYDNIDDWNSGGGWIYGGSVREQIRRLNDIKCKLKILSIACHGDKDLSTDASYGMLSWSTKIQYSDISSLLANAKPDEYYEIICRSCYGGGLFESHVHNSPSSLNYTVVDPDLNPDANYLIKYADCGNSPAFMIFDENGKIHDIEDIQDYDADISRLDFTVSADALFKDVHQKNVDLLVNFMRDHYNFMKDTLFYVDSAALSAGSAGSTSAPKINWSDETYRKSCSFANNLIILASRMELTSRVEYEFLRLLTAKYPIVLLCKLFIAMDVANPYSPSNHEPVSRSDFVRDIGYYATLLSRFKQVVKSDRVDYCYVMLNPDIEPYLDTICFFDDSMDYDTYFNVVNFFYDMYVCLFKMSENAYPLYKLNRGNTHNSVGLLLNDIPGVLINGSPEFLNGRTLELPGFSSGMARTFIRKSDIDKMRYEQK